MAKQSSVQIAAKIDGDGFDARLEPPAAVNAAAPNGGPQVLTLAPGVALSVTPPVGTTGIMIMPGTVADTLQLGGVFGGANVYLNASRTHFFAPDLVAQASYEFFSVGGGTISVLFT